MKLNKLFLLAFVCVVSMTIASCSSDDSFSAGKPYTGENKVSFSDQENKLLSLADTAVEITLVRADATKELTVPIKVVVADPVYFKDIPSSATFAAGEDTISIKIGLTEAFKPYVDHDLVLTIDEKYTNPYAEEGNIITYKATLSKDDWADFKTVDYYSYWFDETYDVNMQYSEYLDLYRLQDYAEEGSVMYIKWDGNEDESSDIYLTNSTGTKYGKSNLFDSGIVEWDYKWYNRWDVSAPTTYDASTKTFTIPLYWCYYSSPSTLTPYYYGNEEFSFKDE